MAIPNWVSRAHIYHLYPLNCFQHLGELHNWLDHFAYLGVNVLHLGPVFYSRSHGYDILDPYRVDPRLGDNESLKRAVHACHARGIRVILDAVFNHVGRDFWAFRDLRQHLQNSRYRSWFHRVSFRQRGRAGDPFSYEGWKGHYDLVKLKLTHPEVKRFQLGALEYWIQEFDIDGLRLDAADCLNMSFMKQVGRQARRLKPDFWLMGEVVHGDYRRWIQQGGLDSITNYSLYHALHTAHNAYDYQILAQTLQEQFGPHGLYRRQQLYHFVDNHDVTRIASLLKQPAQLYPLHILLYTLPGIPSLYYGSEWGQLGQKRRYSDAPLRPRIPHPHSWPAKTHPDLLPVIRHLAQLRQKWTVLQNGNWQLLASQSSIIAYLREGDGAPLIVLVNLSSQSESISLTVPWANGVWIDQLNAGEHFMSSDHQLRLSLSPTWGRILSLQS